MTLVKNSKIFFLLTRCSHVWGKGGKKLGLLLFPGSNQPNKYPYLT